MKNSDEWKIESVKAVSCLQPNQISQGLYKCSPMAKRLLAYTISNLKMIKWNQEKEPCYEVYFRPVQFAKALGLQRIGTKQQQLIKDALEELQSSYIAIDTGDTFQTFAWVSRTFYAPKDKLINICLNQMLGKALIEWQKGFTTIQLIEMGKLQSFYAMRYYEIAQSWSGKKGKDGNKKMNGGLK
jgi:Initiator Replication protein.